MLNTKNQIVAAWCGPGFMLVVSLGWAGFAGFLPPHSPAFTAQEVANLYQANPLGIRIGLVIGLLGSMLMLPFSAVMALQMARIEGGFPVWSAAQIAAGAGTTLTFAFPMMVWATAAFRPDRGPELIQLIDDLGWIPFMGMSSPFMLQPLCIAIVGFMDKSEQPTFPRWACYFNIWADLLTMPGGLVTFFKTGPFAWNGLFGVWVPFVAYATWFSIMAWLLIKAIRRQALP